MIPGDLRLAKQKSQEKMNHRRRFLRSKTISMRDSLMHMVDIVLAFFQPIQIERLGNGVELFK